MSFDTPSGQQRAPEQAQAFCKECGVRLGGAKFCPSCGSASANMLNDSADTIRIPEMGAGQPPQMPVQPVVPAIPTQVRADPVIPPPPNYGPPADGTSASSQSHTTLIVALVAVIVLLIAGGGAALILTSRGNNSPAPTPDTFGPSARSALATVLAANTELTTQVNALSARSSTSGARAAVTSATTAATAAQTTLAALTPRTAADRTLAATAKSALTSELAWLNAAAAVLANPKSAQLSQLSSLGLDATAKLAALGAAAPGAGTNFPISTKIVAVADAKSNAVHTAVSLKAFSGQVNTLVKQSEPAFQQINEVFSELSSAASGDGTEVTLAQLEQTISTVVSNRSALAASARTLSAPTGSARKVRSALVAAMDGSLADDNAIDDCLNQDNNGDVAFIFQSCLSATVPQASAATAAKNHFWSVYNALRHSVGESSTHASF